ncbi:MAG: 16S rRNA (cytidine(1402)-2'-O)-methyltransferase [Chloroflexi bacterium]|nr:16S rRNA (cytidine(1402)-2'-O)-methyltransferase [Chloroflexota bacterium]
MSILYLVATPIGNLEDISPRALRILAEVKLIAAEDTRHSRKLLTHYDIHTPLTSYFEHNQEHKLAEVLATLQNGNVALISDAGMPAINDPGYPLVRSALDAGHEVSPVPGPSAPIAALAASGLPSDQFLYLGYPPRKSAERRRAFESVDALTYTLIWLESPHRLAATLSDMFAVFKDRQVSVAAEMTKRFERFYRGSLQDALDFFNEEPARGEFTIVLAGAPPQTDRWEEARVLKALSQGMSGSQTPSQLARQVAAESGWLRSQVYDLLKKRSSNE